MEHLDTIIDAICYLRSKFPTSHEVCKLTLIKLIYLADRYHILWYGRTITEDKFYVMKHGPVGSLVMDALTPSSNQLSPKDKERVAKYIDRSNQFNIKLTTNQREIRVLSDTDREALDFIYDKFHAYDAEGLKEYVNNYDEVKKRKRYLNSGKKRIPLDVIFVAEDRPGDIVSQGISEDHIKTSKDLLLGLAI